MTGRVVCKRSSSLLCKEAKEGVGVCHGLDVGVRDGLVGDELGRHLAVVGARQVDESSLVAHLVAVVGGREHCDALAVMHHLVAVVFHLK